MISIKIYRFRFSVIKNQFIYRRIFKLKKIIYHYLYFYPLLNNKKYLILLLRNKLGN